VQAECGVVVVQAADLHLRFGHRSQRTAALVAQQLGCGDMLGSEIVWCHAQIRS
jgi:hypothetical protein